MRKNRTQNYLKRFFSTIRKTSSPKACLSLLSKLSFRRITLAGLTAIILASGIILPLEQAFATPVNSLAPGDQAKSFAYYKALRACMSAGYYRDAYGFILGKNPVSHMSQQNAIDYDWFNGQKGTGGIQTNGINVGAFNDPRGTSGDGSQNCGDSEGRAWLAAAAKLWGYTSGPVLLCDLGFTREQTGVSCTDTTNGANNDFIAPGDWQNDTTDGPRNLDNFWSGHLEAGSTDIKSITARGGEYRLFLDNFKSQCRVSPGGSDYTIQEFADGSTSPTATKYGAADRDRGPNYVVTIYEGRQMSCRDIASVLSDANSDVVKGYASYLKINGGKDTSQPTADSCKNNTDPGPCAAANPTTCVVNGTGWLVCTVARTLASAMDGMYNLLELFLKVQPLNVNTSATDNGLYRSWGLMRNFANIAFVIAFLIIILSQVSSIGIDNYNIKKMLPRLIVAAILVNVSYWICAIAVDASNILGVGLKDALIGLRGNLGALSVNLPGWEQMVGWLLAGTGVFIGYQGIALVAATSAAPAIASAALWIVLPAVLGAILAVFVAFAVLAARQALIVILVMLSPLAFVAFLLPNTEKLFTMWRKSITTMLIFYPIFSVIFAGSQLASLVILGSIPKQNPPFGTPVAHIIVLAMFVQVAPLILTPLLIKFSGSTIGRFAGMINNKNKGLIDRAKQVRSRKMGIIGQQALNATPNTYRRGVFKGRRTAGGMMQSLGQNMYDGKKQDEELKSVLDGEILAASNTRRNRRSLIERAGRVEDAQRDMKTFEEQIKETSRPVTVDARLRLNEQELAETKKEAEKRWADMRAEGSGFTVDPALGLGARQTANMVDLATRAHASAVTGTATDSAIKLAQGVEAVNYAKQIQADDALAKLAGGIDDNGKSKARAMATSVINKQFDDAVLAEKSTMTSMDIATLKTVADRRNGASEERRAAAIGMIGKNGGMRDILDTINELGKDLAEAKDITSPNYSDEEAKILSSMQKQFFADAAQKMPVSMTGPSKGALSTGAYTLNVNYEIDKSFTDGKFSGEKLASLTGHELSDIANELSRKAATYSVADKKALKDSIQEYKAAAIALGKTPPPEIAQHLATIETAFS